MYAYMASGMFVAKYVCSGGCRFMGTSLDEMYNVCMFVAKYVCSEGFVFFLDTSLDEM